MNEIIQSIILGIVQGLTEFLPISSSAHLVLFPWFFGWEDPGLSFDVALHLGTLVAVLVFFWKDWLGIFHSAARVSSLYTKDAPANEKEKFRGYPKNFLWFLVLATIPGVLAGVFLNEFAETVFREPLLIAFALVAFGWLLFLADKSEIVKYKDVRQIGLKEALLIGLVQALAIVPGVSRSGVTITAGLGLSLRKEEAARFSFLLATPIIFGAAIWELPGLILGGFGWYELSGIVAAAISGYFAIWSLLKIAQKIGYSVFFWYRLVLAISIILSFLYFGG